MLARRSHRSVDRLTFQSFGFEATATFLIRTSSSPGVGMSKSLISYFGELVFEKKTPFILSVVRS